jgi:hypothetical protein
MKRVFLPDASQAPRDAKVHFERGKPYVVLEDSEAATLARRLDGTTTHDDRRRRGAARTLSARGSNMNRGERRTPEPTMDVVTRGDDGDSEYVTLAHPRDRGRDDSRRRASVSGGGVRFDPTGRVLTMGTTGTDETDSDETETASEGVTGAGAHLRPSGDGWATLVRRGRGGRP